MNNVNDPIELIKQIKAYWGSNVDFCCRSGSQVFVGLYGNRFSCYIGWQPETNTVEFYLDLHNNIKTRVTVLRCDVSMDAALSDWFKKIDSYLISLM